MKQLLLICAVVAVVGCGKKDDPNTGVVNPNKPSPKAVPEKLITDPIVEKAVREELEKPEGKLTEADLEKVTELNFAFVRAEAGAIALTELPKGLEKLTQLTMLILPNNKLTDVKGLEKLTQLTELWIQGNQLTDVKRLEKLTQLKELYLYDNPDLTKVQIDELQKALPNCIIHSNPTK